ncbi:MAG: diguanylate cyclase [Oscillospiraceae bacterium]|nr:diguanylate cyclase [Oscillospiraceae bacterium]
MKIGLKAILSLVLLAVILIPAAAIVLTGTSSSASQAANIMQEEIYTLGYSNSSGLDILLDESVAMLKSVSGMSVIKQATNDNYINVKDEVELVFESLMQNHVYLLDIIVVNADGSVAIDSFGRKGGLFYGFDNVSGTGKNDTPISDIKIGDADYDGADTFFILSHIVEGDNTIGYTALVLNTDLITDYLKSCNFCELYESGDMFVTDRKGTALWLGGAETTRQSDIGIQSLRDLVNSVTGGQNVAGSNSVVKKIDTNGYVGGYGDFAGNTAKVSGGWYWYSVYPSSKIETAPTVLIVMIVTVAVITLICLVLMLMITGKVTGPLRDIARQMKKINQDGTLERLDIHGGGEYTYLSETFNEMLDEVLMGGELHRSISELSDNMLFEWDYKKESLFVSDNFLAMFDVDPARATLINGRFIESIMEKDEAERYKVDINKLLKSRGSLDGEYKVTTKTGSEIWVSVRANCVTDRLGELLRIIGVITNINTEKLLSLQLSEKASFDFLSGLYNRSTFMRELQSEIERSVNSHVGVIFIDVDDFKFINDRYGHNTGDEIIKHVANIIKEKLGTKGFAGRFGGDEFVICVTDEDTLKNIGVLSQAVLDAFDIGYYHEHEDITLKIKGSLGIAIAPEHGRESELVLAAADEAMYYVKKNGKNNYHIYNPDDSVLTELMQTI